MEYGVPTKAGFRKVGLGICFGTISYNHLTCVGENSYDMKHDYRLRTPFHIFVAELNQHVLFKWSSF